MFLGLGLPFTEPRNFNRDSDIRLLKVAMSACNSANGNTELTRDRLGFGLKTEHSGGASFVTMVQFADLKN